MKMITYKGFTIPEEVIPTVKALKDFQFREDDVVITSFPKTGVTWLQEIVWLIANDLNFDGALTSPLQERFPFLEWPLPGVPAISAMAERRFIKTHLPPTILFKPLEEGSPNSSEVKPKVISIIRNPKDTAISYFCFARMNKLIDFKDIFDDFLLFFLPGQVPYGPIAEHYIDVLRLQKQFGKEERKQSDQRVLIIQYEELHFHFQREIDKLCDFLGKPRLDAEKMKALQDHCSFRLMSVNRMVNYEHWDELGLRNLDEARFFRSGKVGDWQKYIDKQQNDALNKWIAADFGGIFEFKFGDESFVE
ncbi:sulfotransferase 1C4-like isoform X2 [Brevipalpus obovatus]